MNVKYVGVNTAAWVVVGVIGLAEFWPDSGVHDHAQADDPPVQLAALPGWQSAATSIVAQVAEQRVHAGTGEGFTLHVRPERA